MDADKIAGDTDNPLTFTLTEQDYIGANRLHSLAAYKRLRNYRVWLIVVLLYWALLFFSGNCHCIRAAVTSAAYALAVATAIVIACGMLGQLVLPSRARRLYRQNKLTQQEQRVSITPEAIVFDAANYHVSQPWGDFIRWGENSRFILLYANDRAFHILPARVLTEELRGAIRQAFERVGLRKDR